MAIVQFFSFWSERGLQWNWWFVIGILGGAYVLQGTITFPFANEFSQYMKTSNHFNETFYIVQYKKHRYDSMLKSKYIHFIYDKHNLQVGYTPWQITLKAS
jgi:hypothetical protein